MNGKVIVLLVYVLSVVFLLTIPSFSQDYVISKNNNNYQVQDLTNLISKQLKIAFGKNVFENYQVQNLAFSPSGQKIAFEIANAIWILNIHTKKLHQVLPPIFRHGVRDNIYGVYWDENNILHIHYQRVYGNTLRPDNNFYLCVYNDKVITSRVPIIIFDESKSWNKFSSKYYSLSGEPYKMKLMHKKNNRTTEIKFNDFDTEYLNVGWSNDGKKFMLAHNHGSGDIRLYIGNTKPKFKLLQIDRGSWELEDFSFSKDDNFIVFPHSKFINIYNIKRKTIYDEIEFKGFVYNLSWSSLNQIAFIQSVPYGWRLKILQFK